MSILVTGCSRSGTTLMSNLIATGFGIEHDHDEGYPEPGHVRKWPFASSKVPEMLATDPDLRVVWMVRDPRAVLISRHPDGPGYWVPPQQWLACEGTRQRWAPDLRMIVVRYEDVIISPFGIQDELTRWLDRSPVVPFSDAVPQFEDDEHNRRVMGTHNRLNHDRLRPWLADLHDHTYIDCVLHAWRPVMQQVARAAGYDLDGTGS